MPSDPLPPLRISQVETGFNQIPVFELVMSGGTLVKLSPTKVRYIGGVGAQGPAGPAGTVTIGSGVGLGSGGSLLDVDSNGNLAQINSAAFVGSARNILSLYPLAGGGNLSADRTLSADTAFLINSGRTISTTYPLAGGGDFSTNRTHTVDTAFLVNTGRTITTLYPVSGGGDFSANRTFSTDTAFLINSGRTLSAVYPISGGGDLSANRSFSVDTAFLVSTSRTISAGEGLTGGGNLSADRTISLVTPVSVTSGGTGAQTFTTFGVLYGSGTTAIQALPAINSGQLIVGSSTTTRPHILGPGADTQLLVAQSGSIGGFSFTNQIQAFRPINAQTGTTYTFVISDFGKMVTFASATATTLTVPSNAGIAFQTNTEIDIAQLGAGQVTVTTASGVNLYSYNALKKLTGQYAGGTLKMIAADTWLLVGNLA